jgi:hypothetical protein
VALLGRSHQKIAILAILLVSGCEPSDSSRDEKARADAKRIAENRAAEKRLLADTSLATSRLVQRLRTSVKMINGLLAVDNLSRIRLVSPESETTMDSMSGAVTLSFYPRETPWRINCGIGLSVVFGSGSTSDESGNLFDNDGTVWLSLSPMSKQMCETFSPLIGKEIQVILTSN